MQYNELVELDKQYSSKGLVIIGAPCNQFGAQEPGSNADIKKFASAQGAKFPMLSKLDVNGSDGVLRTALLTCHTFVFYGCLLWGPPALASAPALVLATLPVSCSESLH